MKRLNAQIHYNIQGKKNRDTLKYIQNFTKFQSTSEPENTLDSLIFLRLARLSTTALLGEEDRVDVGEDPALGNGDTSQQLVQLFVITDGQLNKMQL